MHLKAHIAPCIYWLIDLVWFVDFVSAIMNRLLYDIYHPLMLARNRSSEEKLYLYKIFPLVTLTCKKPSDFRTHSNTPYSFQKCSPKREKHSHNPALQCISLYPSYDTHQCLHFFFVHFFYSSNLYSNQELRIKLNHIYMSTWLFKITLCKQKIKEDIEICLFQHATTWSAREKFRASDNPQWGCLLKF